MSKHVLITGVSMGIGNALAKHYLNEGCHVYGINRSTPEELLGNERFKFVSADFADLDCIASAVSELTASVKDLDLVILNAGVLSRFRDMSDTAMDEIEKVMTINVWSNKVLLDALFAASLNVKQVVGISSGAGISGNRGWNAYSISKATLNMVLRLYGNERSETHFNSFSPGPVDTAMQDYLCALPDDDRYETIQRLKAARGTETMPAPDVAAVKFAKAMDMLLEHPSGDFVDIRDMDI